MASNSLHANPVFDGKAEMVDVEAQGQTESLLRDVPSNRRVRLTFEHISAFVPVLVAPGAGAPAAPPAAQDNASARDVEAGLHQKTQEAPSAPKERQVLFDVQGCVEPGQLLALMGPSGSGKSSLLTVLGGRNAARITGSLRFNGQPLNKAMKRRMGFVTQDDLLFAELTTYETLYYAALLRLPKTWTREQKEERVDMVLRGLGLDKCRDTIIGNHMMRGVSGGERKRVSIGHELLINPSVILLDEPTSGLDSTTALKLVHTLRALASGGRTIIASIHQPSSRLYQEFDKLMLLAEGRTMYYGEAHACAAWFQLQGVPVPFGVSVPDHLLDLACGDLTGATAPADAAALLRRLVAAFERRAIGLGDHGIQPEDVSGGAASALQDNDDGDAEGGKRQADGERAASSRSSDSSAPTPAAAALDAMVSIVKPPVVDARAAGNKGAKALSSKSFASEAGRTDVDATEASEAGATEAEGGDKAESKWGTSWTQQVAILLSRCLRVRRFQALSVQRFVEITVVAILTGLFWFRVGDGELTFQSIADINGLIFFQVLFMAFSTMFSSLFSFPPDFQMLIKERQSGMYRLSAYYVARTISDFPMDCLIPTIFQLIIYFMGGLRLSAGAYFANWASLMLSLLVAQSVGLFLSATISNPKTLLSAATVFMLATMLVAGFYVQSVPVWISWAKYLSFIRYGYILLQKIEFGNRGMSCTDYYKANPDAPQGLTWCPASGSGELPYEVNDPVTLEVCVLLLMFIVVRLGVYWALARRTTFKSKTA